MSAHVVELLWHLSCLFWRVSSFLLFLVSPSGSSSDQDSLLAVCLAGDQGYWQNSSQTRAPWSQKCPLLGTEGTYNKNSHNVQVAYQWLFRQTTSVPPLYIFYIQMGIANWNHMLAHTHTRAFQSTIHLDHTQLHTQTPHPHVPP